MSNLYRSNSRNKQVQFRLPDNNDTSIVQSSSIDRSTSIIGDHQRSLSSGTFPSSSLRRTTLRSFTQPDDIRNGNWSPIEVDNRLSSSTLELARFLQDSISRAQHDFSLIDLNQLAVCSVCQQLIMGKALVCNDCRVQCHIKCELRIPQQCIGVRNEAEKEKLLNGHQHRSAQNHLHSSTIGLSSQLTNGSPKVSRSEPKMNGRLVKEPRDIEVSFVTERILALYYPTGGLETAYRQSLKDVSRMLTTKHGNKYKIFNLSKRRHDLIKLNSQVAEYGWPDDLAPPLERLCSICKDIENWLVSDPANIVVIHSKGGKSRTGVVIAAYLHYTNICASFSDEQALDRFAMRKFYDDHIGHMSQPSQRRYVMYFSGLLSGGIKINGSAIYLQHIVVLGLPLIDNKICRPFIKIYEKMVPVYTSHIYSPTSDQLSVKLESPLQLRGDILLKFYHKKSFASSREVLFRCQFNTCAMQIENRAKLVFSRDELDEACQDRRFPATCQVELMFSIKPEQNFENLSTSQSEAGRDEEENNLTRWDSYSAFETTPEDEDLPTTAAEPSEQSGAAEPEKPTLTATADYTQGPLDGSLYAQIANKRPRGTQDLPDNFSQQPNNGKMLNGADPQRRSDESDSELLEPPEVVVEVKHQAEAYEPSKDFRPAEVTMETTVKSAHLTNGIRSTKVPPKTPPKPLPSPDVTAYRPVTPGSQFESTPQIDTGLVGQDRYDPQSKAFSYVPAHALQEHFKSPKKQTKMVPHGYSDYDEDYSSLGINSDIESLIETPVRSSATPAFPQHSTPIAEEIVVEERPKKATVSSLAQLSTSQPLLADSSNIQQSQSATKHSLDDFLDPNFYLNFNFDTYVPESPKPNVKPPEKPRRDMDFEDFINSVDFRISPPRKSEPTLPAMPKVPVKMELATQKSYPGALETAHSYQFSAGPYRTASIDAENSIDGEFITESSSNRPWRQPVSSSRSVGSTPIHRGWLEDSYPKPPAPQSHLPRSRVRTQSATQSDLDPDEWLEAQLEKLKIRKVDLDPEYLDRKQKEKELLDELRYINEERQQQKGRNEADYSVEGVGTKKVDPFAPEVLLKPRLSLEHSLNQPHPEPYRFVQTGYNGDRSDRSRQPSRTESTADRYGRVTGKPPTPPPRERSRTPPTPRRTSPVTVPTAKYPSSVDVTTDFNGRNKRPSQPATFDNLEAILYEADATSNRFRREPPSPAPKHRETPVQTYTNAQQSPKSILKKPKDDRSTPVTFAGEQQRFFTNGPATNGSNVNLRLTDSEVQLQSSTRPPSQPAQENGAESAANRPETPGFPVSNSRRVETPVPFHPLLYAGTERQQSAPMRPATVGSSARSPSPGSAYYGQSRRSSVTSIEPMEVVHHHPVFVKDTSKYWYKPNISREEAINMLKDKSPGTFVIRDSNSFPGAFGLALKVSSPPANITTKTGDSTELVRHFLIEPTAKGVKLKGCNNEPVFGSLSALVYQHSITPLALPCRLVLPEFDPSNLSEQLNSAAALLEQGAACNVTYIHSCDTESLTGPEAVRRAVDQALLLLQQNSLLQPVCVHFKVSAQGVTVTDNTRKLFFRRHYPVNSVTFCGLDPDDRRWSQSSDDVTPPIRARIFGFVARKIGSRTDNACHIFAELEPEQPSTAIVNFITKVMMAPVQHK